VDRAPALKRRAKEKGPCEGLLSDPLPLSFYLHSNLLYSTGQTKGPTDFMLHKKVVPYDSTYILSSAKSSWLRNPNGFAVLFTSIFSLELRIISENRVCLVENAVS
jgi:hypothetical protein